MTGASGRRQWQLMLDDQENFLANEALRAAVAGQPVAALSHVWQPTIGVVEPVAMTFKVAYFYLASVVLPEEPNEVCH